MSFLVSGEEAACNDSFLIHANLAQLRAGFIKTASQMLLAACSCSTLC